MSHESPARVISYIVGFVLSVVSTLLAYLLVVNHVWPMSMLILIIAVLAVVQLVVQLIFFLHLGDEKGPRWKLVTIVFAIIGYCVRQRPNGNGGIFLGGFGCFL
jgi:cytochrome o ubiquinol oxidase operon protein cyoD